MDIAIKFDNSAAGQKFLDKGLTEYNSKHSQYFSLHKFGRRTRKIGFYAYERNKRIGGCCGRLIMQNWIWVDLFYINEEYRKSGIGTKLMQQVEKYAVENKITGIATDTWDFQAKGFYEKLGFHLYGVLEDCPIGSTVYCFEKKIIF